MRYTNASKWHVIHNGNCTGKLIGGYLADFALMQNSGYLKTDKDEKYILFLEDYEKYSSPAVISKYLSHVDLARYTEGNIVSFKKSIRKSIEYHSFNYNYFNGGRKIMEIGEVCIETNDVIKLANFYRKILNASIECNDEIHQFIISEGTTLTVYNNGEVKNNKNENISLAFTVNDVDEEYKRLLELGIHIIDIPEIQPWGAKNMHFCDPDGNHIYFRSFPK